MVTNFPLRKPTAVAALCAAAALLTACSVPLDVESAENANDPRCADMMVVLPDELAGHSQRPTNSQATSAWGDPSHVVLRCGVPIPGPTTDPCVSVNGVDWVAREGDPAWTLTTYGREPATEVLFDPTAVASSTVLAELAAAAGRIPADRECTSVDQDLELP
ncbi:DUF3515 domain-containing protein [Zafaria sp. Z1313]|uniref:DUF3515 domain-containing protein n=1 Tax=Zafaria sp. Z1313 TaxID=3423202 RepID=UPI003D303741